MKEAIVFGGQNSLDFSEIRQGVVRIPEVSLKIEEAQSYWDKSCDASFSFQHFLTSEDSTFFNNINLKSLSLVIVQLGLVERYARLFNLPEYLVGNVENDSALKVLAGQVSLKDLIAGSMACTMLRPMSPLKIAPDLVLNGRSLPKYQAYRVRTKALAQSQITKDDEVSALGAPDMNLTKVLQTLVDGEEVRKFVHVGPGHMQRSELLNSFEAHDIQIVESIDVDPMLGWFWSNLRRQEQSFSLAQ